MYNLPGPQINPIQVVVYIKDQELPMEVDTGASLYIIIEETHCSLTKAPELQPIKARLCAYTGESLHIVGSTTVPFHHNHQQHVFPLVVVKGGEPSLLGRNWL